MHLLELEIQRVLVTVQHPAQSPDNFTKYELTFINPHDQSIINGSQNCYFHKRNERIGSDMADYLLKSIIFAETTSP